MQHSGSEKLYCLIYVDDLILTRTNLTLILNVISKLQVEFPIKDLSDPLFFGY